MSSTTSRTPRHKRKRSSALPPETINPHSHPPSLLKQFSVAGLPQSELLPDVRGFPHRALPPDFRVGVTDSPAAAGCESSGAETSGRDDDTDGGSETNGTTTTEGESTGGGGGGGDDPDAELRARERRRAETRLRGVRREKRERERNVGVLVAILRRCIEEDDLVRAKRAFGLLVRAKIDGRPVDLRRDGLWGLGAEILMRQGEEEERGAGIDEVEDEGNKKGQRRRWGSVRNMVSARRFFEDLIQLYPYNRLHPDAVSSLDFYPVLFSCEIYNVHVELQMALERLEQEQQQEEEEDAEQLDYEDEEEKARRTKAARDELREGALEVMRGVAGRMDELMMTLPYSKSQEMMRLRGMVALFMGDLEVPAPPRDAYEAEQGMTRRDTERERAVNLFKKVLAAGGELEPWIQQLLNEHGREEGDEDSEEEEVMPMFTSLPIR